VKMVATHLALLILATPALAFYPFHNWFGGPSIAETVNNPCVKLWWFNGDSDNSLDENCSPGDVTEAPMSTMEEDPASDLGPGEEEQEAEEEEEGSLGVEDHDEDDLLIATEPISSATEPSSSEDNDQQGGGWWFGINGDDLLEEDEAFDEDQASEPTVSPTEENQPTSSINDNQQTAEGDYCALDPNHMMCTIEGPSPTCANGRNDRRGLTQAAKDAVLSKHNELRRKVAKGEEAGQPGAGNMRELVWDEELEAMAQRWADQCTFGHKLGPLLDGTKVGQNVASASNWKQLSMEDIVKADVKAVQDWYDEVIMFSSTNIKPYRGSSGTGHYTQLVWAETDRIGCGSVYYRSGAMLTNYIVCNYAVAGNFVGRSVYEQGPACSSCPTSTVCMDSLCKNV